MHSDLDNLIRMLDGKNIPYERSQFNQQTTIGVERGYAGFKTIFTFDERGEFLDIGAFE